MVNKYYKKTKKSFKTKHGKLTKIFLKKKKKKDKKRPGTGIKSLWRRKRKKASISS